MGRRQRKRARTDAAPVETTDYADAEGNVLTLRDSLSRGTIDKVLGREGPAAANAEDIWQRREELLFERLAVRWEIAGLPLKDQRELLGRYRMATSDERAWVRDTMNRHVAEHMPELLP